jgi:hypothetical protein
MNDYTTQQLNILNFLNLFNLLNASRHSCTPPYKKFSANMLNVNFLPYICARATDKMLKSWQ